MHRSGLLSALVECLVSLSVFVPPLPLLPFCLFIVLALYIFIHSSHILHLSSRVSFAFASLSFSLSYLVPPLQSLLSPIIVSPQPCLNRGKTPSTQSSCPFITPSITLSVSQFTVIISPFLLRLCPHPSFLRGSSAQQEGLSARSNDIPHLR